MKRLSERQRKWFAIRVRRTTRRRLRRPPQMVSQRRKLAYESFLAIRHHLPAPALDYDCRPGFCTLKPPANFDFAANYEEVLAFIMDMRALFHRRQILSPDGKRRLKVFAEFAQIQSIEPTAGLILAAEVDRWRIASGLRPKAYDQEWQPAVQHFFSQAGLFELLGIQPQSVSASKGTQSKIETLRFVRGSSVLGEPGSTLRDRLEALCGTSIGPRKTVYDAIAEAIANTRHAYPSGTSIWPAKLAGRWWASGSWLPEQNTVSVQLYDQGVGIPATLPKSEHWSDVFRVAGLLHPERTDDRLLEAALEVGRTSTGQQGRGNGLAEMARWIDRKESGFLRITSGRGSVTYRPDGKTNGEQRAAAFPGTVIEWEVKLDD